MWNVVFGEARNALNAVERQIDPRDVIRAAELVASAHQVTVFGLGGSSSALAQETQNRLFRYGIMVTAHSDPYVMRMTASTLKPNDVVIAISATGRTREVVEAVELAHHYRAKTICITAPDSDLAKICDVKLTVDIPGISRHHEADRVALRLPRDHRSRRRRLRLSARRARRSRRCGGSSTTS